MKKNELQEKVEGLKGIRDSLSGTARDFADAVIAAFEEAERDEQEHTITSLKTSIDEIAARFAEQDQEVAEKIQKLRNDMQRMVAGNGNVKEKFTQKVCNDIAHALLTAKNKDEAVAAVVKVAESAGIEVSRKKNDVSGLSFEKLVDYAIQIKQDESDEIFDALYKTGRAKWFYAELDETDADEIAKQWNGLSTAVTEKVIQDLAVNGKEISTKYIYKRQRIANEDLDNAAEAGQEAALIGDVRAELRKAVKALAVKSILVGDTVNGDGSKVTVFETVGTKTATDVFTTVINPAQAGVITLIDVRKAADAVKTERKWLFVTSALKLSLATRIYADGGTPFFFTDAELAAQLGVDRIIAKDYIGSVSGLHAVVLDPSQYWVHEKKAVDVAWPQYEKNVNNYLYEINMGGAIRGIQSSAVLRSAGGSN